MKKETLHRDWNEIGYAEGNKQEREFIQAVLFHDYVELVDYLRAINDHELDLLDLRDVLQEGFDWHLVRENYIACQLYHDVIQRFEKQITQFDN